ncbi:T9SS type A sorting domain-containing protein [candidate division WOR-3 bacterium]|nr:T9SS type A sorting domain-containing protein [candidate division WOR-3 bacterium]
MKVFKVALIACLFSASSVYGGLVFDTNTPGATAGNGGRKLARETGAELHAVAQHYIEQIPPHYMWHPLDAHIWYAASPDGGTSWPTVEPVTEVKDHASTIALDGSGKPNVCWMRDEGINLRLFHKRRIGENDWGLETELWGASRICGLSVSEPSLTIHDNTAHVVIKVGQYDPAFFIIDGVECAIKHTGVKHGWLDITNPEGTITWEIVDSWEDTIPKEEFEREELEKGPAVIGGSVSIALGQASPGGPVNRPFIVWEKKGEIWCNVSGPDGSEYEKVSGMYYNCHEPFIDWYGDSARVVWSDPEGGIFCKAGAWNASNEFVWNNIPLKIVTFGDPHCPTVAGNHIVWHDSSDGDWEIYLHRGDTGELLQITKNAIPDQYAHSNFQQLAEEQVVRFIWTQDLRTQEEGCPVVYEELCLKGAKLAFSSADVGGETPSPYTEYRDGYFIYASDTVRVDFAYDELVYRLPNLNPIYDYRLVVVGYNEHEGKPWKWNEQVKVDGEMARVLGVASGVPDTISMDIPLVYYEDDNEVEVTMRRLTGDFAAISELKLYQFERLPKGGGAQSCASTEPNLFNLRSFPSPFTNSTTIKYTLPRQSMISLSVYDISGRLVRTLISNEKPSGTHVVKWNGKDDYGKPVNSGIYFYRLEAGTSITTQKTLLLR